MGLWHDGKCRLGVSGLGFRLQPYVKQVCETHPVLQPHLNPPVALRGADHSLDVSDEVLGTERFGYCLEDIANTW